MLPYDNFTIQTHMAYLIALNLKSLQKYHSPHSAAVQRGEDMVSFHRVCRACCLLCFIDFIVISLIVVSYPVVESWVAYKFNKTVEYYILYDIELYYINYIWYAIFCIALHCITLCIINS